MAASTEAPAVNGTKPETPDDFPLDSFREASRHLRRPFTVAAVKFKVQATWPKENPTGGLIVAYIDARLAVERLNLLVPHLWHDAYRPVGNSQMWCDLTVDGITRSDVGEGTGKGLVSDALKRAAVKFGIGVSLYAIPKMRLDKQSGALKDRKTREGMTLEMTPKGERLVRDMYAHWLGQHGCQAFGEPLDHGDVEDNQGDAETDVPAGVDAETGEVVDEAEQQFRASIVADAQRLVEANVLDGRALRGLLVAHGAKDTSSVSTAVASMSHEDADKLANVLLAAEKNEAMT